MIGLQDNPIAAFTEYEFRFTVEHLARAERVADLHRLLALETKDHTNAWYEAKTIVDDTEGYLADISRAWHLSEERRDLSNQIKYALYWSSVVSLCAFIPAALLTLVVDNGDLSPNQAFALAKNNPGERERAKGLAALAPVLTCQSPDLARDLLAEVCEIEDELQRGEALAELVPHLPKTILPDALAAARGIRSGWARTLALAGLRPYLPEGSHEALLEEAFRSALQSRTEWGKAKALRKLIPQLTSVLLEEALSAILQLQDERALAEALLGIAPYLSEHGLEKVLRSACEIEDEELLGLALSELVPHLPRRLVDLAYFAICDIDDNSARAGAFTALIPFLSGDRQETVIRQALEAAKAISLDIIQRPPALAAIASHLAIEAKHQVLEEALEAARQIKDEGWRGGALGGLAPFCSYEYLKEAVSLARNIADEINSSFALGKLVPQLAKLGYAAEALQEVPHIKDKGWRASVLADLVPFLPPDTLKNVLNLAREFRGVSRGRVLAALAACFPDTMCQDIVSAAKPIGDKSQRTKTAESFICRLASLGYQDRALVMAQEIEIQADRMVALARLVPFLEARVRKQVLAEAWTVLIAVESKADRIRALGYLAPYLETRFLEEGLAIAKSTEDSWDCAKALVSLVPYLPEGMRIEVFFAAQAIESERVRALALAALGQYQPDSMLEEMLVAAQEIVKDRPRAKALIGLVPHLSEELLNRAVAVAKTVKWPYWRDRALGQCASQFARLGHIEKTWAVIQEMKDDLACGEAIECMAPYLPDNELSRALDRAQEIDERARSVALVGLLPFLPESLQPQVFEQAIDLARSHDFAQDRAMKLTTLSNFSLPSFRTPLLKEALTCAAGSGSRDLRRESLGALSPHLASLPKSDLKSIWFGEHGDSSFLHTLARQDRNFFLRDLAELTDPIAALGGPEVIVDTIYSIRDISRWWP